MITTIDEFKKLLNSADAITIGDSPIIKNWQLDEDEGDLISAKWPGYLCYIRSKDVQEIEIVGKHYVITLPNSKEIITLLKVRE